MLNLGPSLYNTSVPSQPECQLHPYHRCSFIALYCRSPQANCLLEEAPVKSEMYNMSIQDLPGQVYNADQQCKHIYGDHASTCQFQLSNVSYF